MKRPPVCSSGGPACFSASFLRATTQRGGSWPTGLLNQDGDVVSCGDGDGEHVSRGRLN